MKKCTEPGIKKEKGILGLSGISEYSAFRWPTSVVVYPWRLCYMSVTDLNTSQG